MCGEHDGRKRDVGVAKGDVFRWVLSSAGVGVLSGVGVLAIPTPARAQSGLQAFERKAKEIARTLERVLAVGVLVGLGFLGFRFIQGDPQAWRYAMYWALGAIIIFTAKEIVKWIGA